MNEGSVDGEEFKRSDFAGPGQPTLRHPGVVQGHRVPSTGELRRQPAEHEILAMDDEDEGGPALRGGEIREGKRDRYDRSCA